MLDPSSITMATTVPAGVWALIHFENAIQVSVLLIFIHTNLLRVARAKRDYLKYPSHHSARSLCSYIQICTNKMQFESCR